ncbi:hypothetical protein [Lentibacillus sp. JNUCC-1]|uniref:hypothetical protein n=1 Tax=Lentibacillus sp. JNUCC-1 TaxID=2654513 RepID=UPI0018D26C32|nr:hypothetical protein [Lentibacillus sp. JNUCC-1]
MLLTAVVLITFFPVLSPTVYAISSWTGDSWEGNPWSGSPWDGSNLKWIGEDIKPSQANDIEVPENEIELPWYLEGGEGDDSSSDDWTADGFIGNRINGKPTAGMIAEVGNDDSNKKIADSMEFLTTDIMGGNAKFISDGLKHQRYLDSGQNGSGFGATSRSVYSNMLVNGFKLSGADNKYMTAAESAVYFNEGVQGYKVIKNAHDYRQIPTKKRDLSSKANTIKNISKMGGVEKVLSRFSIVTAGVSAAYSGWDTAILSAEASKVVKSDASGTQKTIAVANATESAGDFLISGGVLASAVPVPGFRVAGGVIILIGAALWGASKVAKFYAKNWDTIKLGYKAAWEGIKHFGKKGLKSIVKGLNS